MIFDKKYIKNSGEQKEDVCKCTEKEKVEFSSFKMLSKRIIQSWLVDQSDYLLLHLEPFSSNFPSKS